MEKKLNKKRVKKNKKPKNVLVITTIYVICFSVIAGDLHIQGLISTKKESLRCVQHSRTLMCSLF